MEFLYEYYYFSVYRSGNVSKFIDLLEFLISNIYSKAFDIMNEHSSLYTVNFARAFHSNGKYVV